jgi:hypothetical protein
MNVNQSTTRQDEENFAKSRSIQVTPVSTEKHDAIFDFNFAKDKQSNNIHSNIVMMRDIQGNSKNTQLDGVSENFAQQLDFNSIEDRFMDNGFDTTSEMATLFLQSRKHIEQHDYTSVIGTYLTLTHSSNLLARDVKNSFKRSIISSLKLSDTTKICEAMEYELPQEGLIRFEKRVENVYGDYSEWEKILQVLSFEDESINEYLRGPESDFGNDLPTIKFVLTTLHQIGAEMLSITDALKIYLLTNIKSITSLVAITAFLRESMSATFSSTDASFIFTACMADSRFTQEQFSDDLAWFMQNLVVCSSFEAKCLFFMETKQSMMKWSQSEKKKEHLGRPRLRYRVGVQQKSNGSNTNDRSDSLQQLQPASSIATSSNSHAKNATQITPNAAPSFQVSQTQGDSLQGWSLRARIPPAISHKSRLFGYVLMGQTTFADPSESILTHFCKDKDLASNIISQKVFKLHTDVIVEFLKLLTVHVTPFKELIAFRDDCFTDFSHTDSKDLSWSRFLQLYVAAHQNEDIWRDVWKCFCNVLSHQVLITVADFKKHNVYAVGKVAELCMRGEE